MAIVKGIRADIRYVCGDRYAFEACAALKSISFNVFNPVGKGYAYKIRTTAKSFSSDARNT